MIMIFDIWELKIVMDSLDFLGLKKKTIISNLMSSSSSSFIGNIHLIIEPYILLIYYKFIMNELYPVEKK
ncbi:hypothetical protein DERP_014634 [Dermatophagoides pteronyssinus]|uniref:Uncharacterized protein n=1 Tax=Dermatophagoides pteronyssinus TaxID=6956 RepID=A0ABQ8IUC2_DERPT|nr:hypothetical protein DERP_014634 [Dermatophagoides pteronyssinus]